MMTSTVHENDLATLVPLDIEGRPHNSFLKNSCTYILLRSAARCASHDDPGCVPMHSVRTFGRARSAFAAAHALLRLAYASHNVGLVHQYPSHGVGLSRHANLQWRKQLGRAASHTPQAIMQIAFISAHSPELVLLEPLGHGPQLVDCDTWLGRLETENAPGLACVQTHGHS